MEAAGGPQMCQAFILYLLDSEEPREQEHSIDLAHWLFTNSYGSNLIF